MSISFFGIFTVIIFIIGLMLKKSKIVSFIQIIWLWIIMGWNSGGMDFNGNEIIYFQSGKLNFSGFSSGWLSNIITFICHKFELSFIQYNILTTGVALIILYFLIISETDRPCVAIDLFYLYPFLDSLVQKRYFLGMIFIILGIHFLIKRKYVNYIVCVLLALGFHFSFLIFFPLVFIHWFNLKREKYVLIVCLVLELLVITQGTTILGHFFSLSKLQYYIFDSSYSSKVIGAVYALWLMTEIFVVDKMLKNLESNTQTDFVIKLNKIFLIFVPMCYFESAYLRYYRVVIIWTYIIICKCKKGMLINEKKLLVNAQNIYLWIFVLMHLGVNYIIYYSAQYGLKGYLDTVITNKLIY